MSSTRTLQSFKRAKERKLQTTGLCELRHDKYTPQLSETAHFNYACKTEIPPGISYCYVFLLHQKCAQFAAAGVCTMCLHENSPPTLRRSQ